MRITRGMKTPKTILIVIGSLGLGFLLFVTIGFLIFWFGVSNERLLVNAARKNDLEAIKKIQAKGISLDALENGMLGQTALIASTFTEHTNAFSYLLANGVNVNARSRDGKTALMTAVMLGDGNVAKTKALIEAGADVNARNHGASVLQYAEWASQGRTSGFSVTNTINLLKEHGATN